MVDSLGCVVVENLDTKVVEVRDGRDDVYDATRFERVASFPSYSEASWFVQHLSKTGGLAGWRRRCASMSLF